MSAWRRIGWLGFGERNLKLHMSMTPVVSAVIASRVAHQYAGGIIEPFTHLSLPIPCVQGGSAVWLFLAARAEIVEPRAGLQLWAPTYLVRLLAADARLDSIRSIDPAELGYDSRQREIVGSCLTPSEQQRSEFLTAKAQCDQACDLLVPSFFEGRSAPPAEMSRVSEEYLRAFVAVSEPAWKSAYEVVGSAFFAWLRCKNHR